MGALKTDIFRNEDELSIGVSDRGGDFLIYTPYILESCIEALNCSNLDARAMYSLVGACNICLEVSRVLSSSSFDTPKMATILNALRTCILLLQTSLSATRAGDPVADAFFEDDFSDWDEESGAEEEEEDRCVVSMDESLNASRTIESYSTGLLEEISTTLKIFTECGIL